MDELEDGLYKAPFQAKLDGMQMPSHWTSQERFDQIRALETTEKDIILAAYPRCGSTWMIEVLYLLQTQGDFEGALTRHMSNRRIFIDITTIEKLGGNTKEPYYRALDAYGKPRLMKTHAHVRQLEKPIRDGKAKIVVVLRNPKEALVSYYHFYKSNKPFAGEFDLGFDHFFKMFKAKQLMFGDWLDFYSDYWLLRDKPNIHFVVYEEAKRNIRKTVTDLARFLEVDIADDLIDRICAHVDFSAMKDNPACVVEGMKDVFVRQGQVGKWKEIFTVAQSEELDALYGETITKLGLPVQYTL